MTFRDVGNWFVNKWDAALNGFHIATTQSFWDWPLWLSLSVSIGVPILVLCWIVAMVRELHNGAPEPLGWIIGFGIATFLCALVTYDLWVSLTIWDKSDKNTGWLRIGYPIMTTFFGSYFFISVLKRRRRQKEQADE